MREVTLWQAYFWSCGEVLLVGAVGFQAISFSVTFSVDLFIIDWLMDCNRSSVLVDTITTVSEVPWWLEIHADLLWYWLQNSLIVHYVLPLRIDKWKAWFRFTISCQKWWSPTKQPPPLKKCLSARNLNWTLGSVFPKKLFVLQALPIMKLEETIYCLSWPIFQGGVGCGTIFACPEQIYAMIKVQTGQKGIRLPCVQCFTQEPSLTHFVLACFPLVLSEQKVLRLNSVGLGIVSCGCFSTCFARKFYCAKQETLPLTH